MRVGFSMCRGWYFGALKGRKQEVHVCGKEQGHRGHHQCFCGETFGRNKKQKLCSYWQQGKPFAGIDTAQPSGKVTDDQILELFGKRKMDL